MERFQKVSASDIPLYEDGYIGHHGWYWGACSSFVARAFRDRFGEECLPYVTLYEDPFVKYEARGMAAGCHDTIHSVIVRVATAWSSEMPTAEDVYNAFCKTNAQFSVEKIYGGYHFYKLW